MPGKTKTDKPGRKQGQSGGGDKPATSSSANDPKHPDQKRAETEEEQALKEKRAEEPAGESEGQPAESADEAEPKAETSGPEEAAEPEAASAKRDTSKPESETFSEADNAPERFPVIGLGASAGGLEALEKFFTALPEQSGMAFVVLVHTGPEHASLLPDILRRKTRVKIHQIEDGMPLEPDAIFIPPSGRDVILQNETFQLQDRPEIAEKHMPADRFFKRLAAQRGERAGCVILSGTGTDGTRGLLAIKEKAGLTLAQSKQSAKYTGMPASAIDTGQVDYVLAPGEMPERLIEYFQHPATAAAVDKKTRAPDDLHKILRFLAGRTKHDFSLYKESTLTRRIQRRAAVTRSRDLTEYFQYLNRNPEEVGELFQDLLIGVTDFFRDPQAFDALKEVLSDLISAKPEKSELRIWVAGCATGEEAYSVAILVDECMKEHDLPREVQIFGTDIDARAIAKARHGFYPKSVADDLGSERLGRYFEKAGDSYQVKKNIREQVIFAEQNLLRDPPFSKLDLLVCRNLLIYLKPEAQKKLIPLFHHVLNKDGLLFLGTSETVSPFPKLFHLLNKPYKIYRKKENVIPPDVEFPTGKIQRETGVQERKPSKKPSKSEELNIAQAAEKVLIRDYAPPCLIVDPEDEIIHIHGRTGKYLEPAQGKPSMKVVDMAREGLQIGLISALRRASRKNETVREKGLRIKTNGEFQWIDLTVKKLDQAPLKDCLLVVFEDIAPPETPSGENGRDQDPDRRAGEASEREAELEQELSRVRQDYRSALEELETSNEELRSVNEELHSSNEELQSTNEELESSREELESVNEELNTVNSELYSKVEELNEAYAAVTNVLNSTRIAIIFLDNDLRVRRFTEEAEKIVNLVNEDIDRPFHHISHNLDYEKLTDKAREVLKNLTAFEDEVGTKDGHWYRMSIMAYRSPENVIEGVVLTFVNIDEQKKAQEHVEQLKKREVAAAKRLAESIIDTVRESLLVLDSQMQIRTANRRFYDTFHTDPEQVEGKSLFRLGDGQWDIPELRKLLQDIVHEEEVFEDYQVEHRFPEIGFKKMLLNGRLLRGAEAEETKILLAIEDVTHKSTPGSDSDE